MHDVAILLFDGVEVLDFAAPFETLSLAGTRIVPGTISVRTVGVKSSVTARNGLVVCPSAADLPAAPPDVLVLPGGPGVEPLIEGDPRAMEWIRAAARKATWVMSICSGALFLASAGLLKDRRAITHRSDIAALKALEPTVSVQEGKRFVRDDKFITSAGISAGLDASLFLVAQLLGEEAARNTADWMEYTSDAWFTG